MRSPDSNESETAEPRAEETGPALPDGTSDVAPTRWQDRATVAAAGVIGSVKRGLIVPDTFERASDGLSPDAHHFAERFATRIFARRWLLAIFIAVLCSYVLTGSLHVLQAVGGCTAVLLAGGLLPRKLLPQSIPASGAAETLERRIAERFGGLHAAQWQGVVSALSDPAILVGRDDTIIYLNARAEELMPRLQTGVRLTALVRDPDLRELLRLLPHSTRPLSAEFVERGDMERRFRATVAWLSPPEDQPATLLHPLDETPEAYAERANSPAALVTLRDLTEQTQFSRMRTDFISYASHELRTPLASLMGFIETLQGPGREDIPMREVFLDRMASEAERMNRLIEDLTRLSTIEMKQHILPTGRVDLAASVEHVVDTLDPLARDSGATIEMELNVDEAPIRGEGDDIIQALTNVITNAVRYGGAGTIHVTLEKLLSLPSAFEHATAPAYMITVRDEGPGIDADHLPRLTERFYRVDVAQSRAKGGTGLGLALVKYAVLRHRGDMRVESKIGSGTSVSLVFSADEAAS